jgi:hypothetical protein
MSGITIDSETHSVSEQRMRASTTQEVPADLFVRPYKVGIGNTHCLWTHHLLLECQEKDLSNVHEHQPPEASVAFQRVDPFCEVANDGCCEESVELCGSVCFGSRAV